MPDVWSSERVKVEGDKLLSAAQFNNSSNESPYVPVPPHMFRHRMESVLLWVSVILTVSVVSIVLAGIVVGAIDPLFILVLSVPIVVYVYRAVSWGKVHSSYVMVTQEQFTDVWVMVNKAAREYGCMVPEVFVFPGNGRLDIHSSGHEHRRYMALSSDLVELGGKGRSSKALEFAIYHEMAHIAAGHRNYWRVVLTMIGRVFPILGKALSRSECYTADCYASTSCPEGITPYVGALASGKYLGELVDYTSIGGAGNSSPWVVVANVISRVPVLSWRVFAMTDSAGGPKSGSLFFAPNN